ncbi:MAG: helix-turn-helix domain-containing protein [Candidatus Omnitrophica bacterium]|nr:helix-turn-helix domain-containing protein [Candidatus Omnitrophota bacterium]
MRLNELGARIRVQREKLGLKQTDIAHALQISPQAVSKWERAENGPDITILGDLAKLLGVSTDWLLGLHVEDADVFEATVFASSVSGAYKKSLGMKPACFALWANGLFYALTEAILRFDGVPIKCMGDQFLCFFSGASHGDRAIQAARLARDMVSENLVIGLSSGEIYLGAVGHPEYARPDIMGEIVNLAFLTMEWAEMNAQSRMAATERVAGILKNPVKAGKSEPVKFKGISSTVKVGEIVL